MVFASTAAFAQVAAPQPEKHVLFGMLYVGGHHYFGDAGKNVGTGLRLGTIFGGRLNPRISLNGELTLDILNPKDLPPGVDASGLDAEIAFSPLFHFPRGNVELVVGPKLGARVAVDNVRSGGFKTGSSTSGYTAGINAGLFFALSPYASLGALLNFEARTHDESCARGSGLICTTQNPSAADKVMGINVAVVL